MEAMALTGLNSVCIYTYNLRRFVSTKSSGLGPGEEARKGQSWALRYPHHLSLGQAPCSWKAVHTPTPPLTHTPEPPVSVAGMAGLHLFKIESLGRRSQGLGATTAGVGTFQGKRNREEEGL